MDKILTVGIPAYNAEKTLRDCLNSFVCTGVMDDVEIIVVNDGSKDSTSEIAHEYEARYPGSIRVVDKENGGHGSGINTTIKYATGKYLKIVDSDDAVDREGFISLVNELKHTEADLVLSPYYRVRNGLKEFISYYKYDSVIERNEYTVNDCMNKLKITMHSMTYRTELLKKSKYRIDEKSYYVDVEYTSYYIVGVSKILLLTNPVYLYTVGNDNQSISLKSLHKNIEQHIFVSERLIEFYNDISNDVCKKDIQIFVREYIVEIVLSSYRVIFSLPDIAKSKHYLLCIEKFTKTNNMDIYKELANHNTHLKITYLLSLLRRTHYRYYSLLRWMLWHNLKRAFKNFH